MTRKQWLAAMRLTFPGSDPEELREEIFQARRKASRHKGYWPGKLDDYESNHVAAYYHVRKDRQWCYVQNYGPENAFLIAAARLVREVYNSDPYEVCPQIMQIISENHIMNSY